MLTEKEKTKKENKRLRDEERVVGNIEGRIEERKNIIKTLFKNKMTPKEISEKTGIALNEILKIVKEFLIKMYCKICTFLF